MVLGSYPGGHPLENGHMEVHGSVLSAHTQGETHWQNDTSLAGRPKDTNPYPGRDPYRGGGASRRLHKGGRPPPFVDSFMDGCGEAVEAAEAAEPAIARISHDFP